MARRSAVSTIAHLPSTLHATTLNSSTFEDLAFHTSAAAGSSTTHFSWNNYSHCLDNGNSTHNSRWVEDTVGKMEAAHKPKSQQLLQKPGRWEMLSLEETLASLERMPCPPSIENMTCILRKCRKERNPAYAMRLHAYMRKTGLETHKMLGNYLVPMLVEVGRMCDAQHVFDRLVVDRNEFSWTSLITGYIECGEFPHAFMLYQKMQEDSVHPSGYTFLALLNACARLKDTERGQEIHAEIAAKGWLERYPFVGNALVDMYAKCGSFAKSHEVFDQLPVRDAVSWNALIAGYAEHGLGQEALNCFEQMQLEGVSPDAITLVCSLKACGSIGAISKGQEIDAQIAREGLLERNRFVGNTLVDMYAKCGFLAKAQEVFDKLSVRDAVSWTALIAGYAEHGLGQEALNCFEQMPLEGVSPNVITFVFSLKACGNLGAIEEGLEIHAEIATKRLEERYPFVGNALVDMYAKCGSLSRAREVFDKLLVRDAVSWNALMAGYSEHGLGQEALNCLESMQLEGISPDAITFVCSLKACGNIGAIDEGQEIHAQIARNGFLARNPFIGNTLVDMYAKCGWLTKAREVFDKLAVQDAVSWTALIAGYTEHDLCQEALNCFEQMQLEGVPANEVTFVYSLKACGNVGAIEKGIEIHSEIATKGLFVGSTLVDMYAKCGLLAKAQEVFHKLPVRDAGSWNALMAGYAEHGLGQEALNCFEQIRLEGISPDAITFVCSLKACGSIGAIEKGIEIHTEIATKGLLEIYPFAGNALVDMYAKWGWLAKAQEVFDKLPVRDAVSWNALIAGYANLGESEDVLIMLDRMRAEDIQPDGVTFLSILTVCNHAGQVDKSQIYFEAMSKNYGITPTIEHHTCMVDLLGRAGQLDKAVVMIKKMPFDPDLVLWHTVLAACWKWGNVELGRWAFEHAVQLDEKDSAAYVLMSNIYADAHMQEDARQVEIMRLKQALSFVRDTGCSQSSYIHGKLEDLSIKMRQEGNVPDLQCPFQDMSDDVKEAGLCGHGEKLPITCALISTPKELTTHVTNVQVCKDCHLALISKVEQQSILFRDANCFHVFENGNCVFGDYW